MKTKRTKIVVGVLAATAIILGVAYAALWVHMAQGFSNPALTVVASPALTGAEVWLLEQGFVDRGFTLFVRSPRADASRVKKITPLDSDGMYSFRGLQWSRDGQVAVLVIILAYRDRPEIRAFAYDFSAGSAVLPAWQDIVASNWKSLDEWKQHESVVLAQVQVHGGLADEIFDVSDIKKQARKLRFSQVPKG